MGNLQSLYIPQVWIATTSHAAVFKIIDDVWNHQINVMGFDLSKSYKLSIFGQEAEIRFLANESVWFALSNNDSKRELNEVLYIHLRPPELKFLRTLDSTSDDEVEVIKDSTISGTSTVLVSISSSSSSLYEELNQITRSISPSSPTDDNHYQSKMDELNQNETSSSSSS
ncbi:uncharacterized protein LOC141533493 [Cotesia typhae]|uniref:uncharacterized protein LOC141533493 n=1 Tax=Cotesia typhae TaxID=2053667 RepID=UPI003D68BF21